MWYVQLSKFGGKLVSRVNELKLLDLAIVGNFLLEKVAFKD